MLYLIISALLTGALGIILLIRWAKKPYKFKNITIDKLSVHLHALLKRGYNGAFLIIQDMDSEKFVQFAKYITPEREIGLELSFGNAPWAQPYYEKLKQYLKIHGIEFKITPVNSSPTTEFIDVDCRSDLGLASRLVEGICRDIFEVRGELFFQLTPSDISAKDELIDRTS